MRYLGTREIPIADLAAYPANPRTHNAGVLEESARVNGQYRSVVARECPGPDGATTLQLLAGHGTVAAFAATGATAVRVEVIDADDTEARRIVVVDNRANDLAGYDDALLADLLGDLGGDYPGTGWDADALAALTASLRDPNPAGADPDDAPDPPAEPVTRPGDVWVLGEHRLVCADARDPDAYTALLGGERAGCMWTDPPYGVDYEGKTADALRIRNDGAADLPGLLTASFAAASAALTPGAAVYVAHPPGALHTHFVAAFLAAGWSLRQTLIWVKDTLVLGRSDYHYRHEPILFGYTPGATGRRGRGGKGWYGDNAQTSVFEIPRPTRSTTHPTMKPAALIEAHLTNSAAPGSLVLDPFAGSGSTLIAAHLCGRRARCIELDPVYADVIAARFQALTSVLPVREADGVAVDFLAAG